MRTMIIEFNYCRKSYRFSKYIKDDFVAHLEAEAFLTECCEKIGVNPKRATGKLLTVVGWHYWVEF